MILAIEMEAILTGVIALVGGLASGIMWITQRIVDIKEGISEIKLGLEVMKEKVEGINDKIGIIDAQIEVMELESDRRLEVLEEEAALLFNYLVFLYKSSGEVKHRTEDMQSFLENAIVSYVKESGTSTVNRSYKRVKDRCAEDVNDEMKQLVMSFTTIKASNSYFGRREG